MNKLFDIVVSKTPPISSKSLWVKPSSDDLNGTMQFYGNKGWTPIILDNTKLYKDFFTNLRDSPVAQGAIGHVSLTEQQLSQIPANSIVLGPGGRCTGENSIAGSNSRTLGNNSSTFSGGLTTNSNYSHADSKGTVRGNYSHADSYGETRSNYSHANTKGCADGEYSFASSEGITYGDYSSALSGGISHGKYSSALSKGRVYSCESSHSNSGGIVYTGNYGYADTNGSVYAEGAHCSGIGNGAYNPYEFVCGKYSEHAYDSIFKVGTGNEEKQKTSMLLKTNDDFFIRYNQNLVKVQDYLTFIESNTSSIEANNSLLSLFSNMLSRISALEKSKDCLKNQDTLLKRDFLPDHEQSKFCTYLHISYTPQESSQIVIKINNKEIVTLDSGTDIDFTINRENNRSKVKLLIDSESQEWYIDDSVILQIDIDTTENITYDYKYTYVPYEDVNVYWDKPIYEHRDGYIIFCNDSYTPGGIFFNSVPINNEYNILGEAVTKRNTKAVFQCGICNSLKQFLNTTPSYGTNLSLYKPERKFAVEYCYMSNWDFSNCNDLQLAFYWQGAKATAVKKEVGCVIIPKLDFSKINKQWDDLTSTDNICTTYMGESIGDLTNLDISNISIVTFQQLFNVKILGNLAKWDTTNKEKLEQCFSSCFNLEYIGDIGKWNITNKMTSMKNLFARCLKLTGISSAISNWDMSNNTQCNDMFDSTLSIGDDTLYKLGKWDMGKCERMNGMFQYFNPASNGFLSQVYPNFIPNFSIEVFNIIGILEELQLITDYELYNHTMYTLIEKIKEAIVYPKSDLSFIADWDVHSLYEAGDMMANNPYLVNVGDLRKWNLTDEIKKKGMPRLLAFCTALENLDLPTIPRGTSVVDIVRGCTNLKNIRVNQLLVESISFKESPLTMKSVLNLINATNGEDSVTIYLKHSVYEEAMNDSSIREALQSKNNMTVLSE